MAVNTGVNISKAVGYAAMAGISAGVGISKAVAYAVLTGSGGSGPPDPCAKHQRGNIDYDQIRLTVRQGSGGMFQMFGGGGFTSGHVAVFDVCGNVVDGGSSGGSGGSGTVTSVAMTVPSRQSVSGSPITTSGTLAITDNTQAANLVFAGPLSGSAVPTFRALTAADLPATGTAPVIRGSGIQASSASSYTVTWPTGTVAGDMAVIMVGHGYAVTTPSGWTQLDNEAGTQWNGAAFYRVLSAADITTGNVTVSVGGVYDGVVSIATFKGATGTPRMVAAQRNGSGASSVTLTTDGSPLTTDVMLYFGSNRAASTDTVSLGSNLQQANDAANASGCLFGGSPAASGALSPVFSYSVAGTGNYQIVIDVPSTGGGGTVTSVGLTMPAEYTVSGSPVTSSGSFTVTKASQSGNLIYASPSGSSGAPVFRSLVSADFPSTVVNGFQTPWLSDINGAGFRLLNAGNIGVGMTPGNAVDVTSASAPYIGVRASSTSASVVHGVISAGAPFLRFYSDNVPTYCANISMGVVGGAAISDLVFSMLASGTWTERMRLTNAGRLGIATSAPAYPLDITGSINNLGDHYVSGNVMVNLYNDGTNIRMRNAGSGAIFQPGSGANPFTIYGVPSSSAAGSVASFRTVAQFTDQSFYIYPNSGSLNIWTTGSLSGTNALPSGTWTTTIVNPVNGASYNGLVIANAYNATTSKILSLGSVSTAWSSYQEFFSVDGVGNVKVSPSSGATVQVMSSLGIGMTPGNALDILSASAPNISLRASSTSAQVGIGIIPSGAPMLRFFSDNVPTYQSNISLGVIGGAAISDLVFSMYGSGTWAERMRLTNSGRLGIATSAPGAPLHVVSSQNNAIIIQTTSAASNFISFIDGASTPHSWWVGQGLTGTTDGTFTIYDQVAGQSRFSISSNGNIAMPSLPSANPGAGTKQLWYDPTDSNRVKYAA